MKSSDIKWLVMIILLLLFTCTPIFAQTDSLLFQINTDHLQLKKGGMTVLGGWAVSNLVISGFMMTRSKGVDYHFHEMNVFWNVINLGIAAGGYYGAMQGEVSDLSLIETLQSQEKFGNILLFNAGLDVGYVMSGLYLRERAKNSNKYQQRLKGYGNSIILQGSFLFVFDLVLYGINENAITSWLEGNNLAVNISPSNLSFTYFFN